jgi:hypothetical protein
LIKSARIWRPEAGGDVGKAKSEEASMMRRSSCAMSLQRTGCVM